MVGAPSDGDYCLLLVLRGQRDMQIDFGKVNGGEKLGLLYHFQEGVYPGHGEGIVCGHQVQSSEVYRTRLTHPD